MRTSLATALSLMLLTACGGGSGGGTPDQETPGAQVIVENFTDVALIDAAATDADWGVTVAGVLTGQPVTTRKVYVYSYRETDSGTDSGRGEYVDMRVPLTGSDRGTISPPTSAGRRMQVAVSDTELGPAGVITNVAWGPSLNQTVAATYPNVRLRMGYLDQTLPGAPSSVGTDTVANFAGTPTLCYDGPYTVAANLDVGNTPGHPLYAHAGGYTQGAGCAVVNRGWNVQLFDYTGWYDWPALTTYFEWDPGSPTVDNDSVLVFDASVQEGTASQGMRGWFAVQYPCSGLLIGGHPEPMLLSTYEGLFADPIENPTAGILNPSPAVIDICLTFSRLTSTAQSKFIAGAYGDDTNYLSPTITPATQPTGASILVEYQGADAVLADGVTIDTSAASTGWVSDPSACNGMQYIRYRVTLTSGLSSAAIARVESITVPMADATP